MGACSCKKRESLPYKWEFKKELCFGTVFYAGGNMARLKFYKVDMKYIRNLTNVDDKVMSVSPQNNKETRPFLGVIIV